MNRKLETFLQNKYKVICRPDEGKTGRFDITFYKNEEDFK